MDGPTWLVWCSLNMKESLDAILGVQSSHIIDVSSVEHLDWILTKLTRIGGLFKTTATIDVSGVEHKSGDIVDIRDKSRRSLDLDQFKLRVAEHTYGPWTLFVRHLRPFEDLGENAKVLREAIQQQSAVLFPKWGNGAMIITGCSDAAWDKRAEATLGHPELDNKVIIYDHSLEMALVELAL